MKGALLFLGALVCVFVSKADGADTLCGCSEPCVREYVRAFADCPGSDFDTAEDYVACFASHFSDYCYDCLCDYVYLCTGGTNCPPQQRRNKLFLNWITQKKSEKYYNNEFFKLI